MKHSFRQTVLAIILVFLNQQLFAETTTYSEQCDQEASREVINVTKLEMVCLQAGKKADEDKNYENASWYYLLAGKYKTLLKESIKHIEPKKNTVIFANIAHAYVLNEELDKALEFYEKYLLASKVEIDVINEHFKDVLQKIKSQFLVDGEASISIFQILMSMGPIDNDYKVLDNVYRDYREELNQGKKLKHEMVGEKIREIKNSYEVKNKKTTPGRQVLNHEENGHYFSSISIGELRGIDNKLSGSGNGYEFKTTGNLKATRVLSCENISEIKSIYTPAELFPASIKCMVEGKYAEAIDYYLIAHVFGSFDELRVKDRSAKVAINMLIHETIVTLRELNLPAEVTYKLIYSKLVLSDNQTNKSKWVEIMKSLEDQKQLLLKEDSKETLDELKKINQLLELSKVYMSDDHVEKTTNYRRALCEYLKDIGMPTYHPEYMIQHGLVAQMKELQRIKEVRFVHEGKDIEHENTIHLLANSYGMGDSFMEQVMNPDDNGIISNINLKENWKSTLSDFLMCNQVEVK